MIPGIIAGGMQQGGGADPYFAAVMALNPIGYWRFTELAGTSCADFGSAGVTGTYTGTVSLGQPSLCGDAGDYALGMSGAGRVDLGNPSSSGLRAANDFTVIALINPTNDSNNRGIWSYYAGGFGMRITNFNRLMALKTNVAVRGESSSTFPAGVKALAAVSVSSTGVLTLYKNGSADGTGVTASDYNAGSQLIIGNDIGLSLPYTGIVDEVAYFSPALTGGQIATLASIAGL